MKSKKLLAIALLGLSFVWLTACGNKDVLGTTFTFNYAKVKMVDGQIVEGKVKRWAKYEKQDSIRVQYRRTH